MWSTTAVACGSGAPPALQPALALTVDGLGAPIGLATNDVQFAWHVGDLRRGAIQRAYRIVVNRGASVAWDSGQVMSSDQAFVNYGGAPLAADTSYRWSVQTWSASGGPSAFAPRATFETGLADGDWRASWIQRATSDSVAAQDQYTYARKEFDLRHSPIVRARAYVSGDQQYELYINGARAGKGQAYSYPDSHYYETLDVTRLMQAGARNAVGIVSSWQGATKGHPAGTPGMIAQISVTHSDGSVDLITSEGSWRVLKGPWLAGTQRNLEGDQVDFTENINGPAEPVGWDHAGFNDASWAVATVVGRHPVAPWTHLVSVRTRIVEEPVSALSVTRLASGAFVADFGRVYTAVPTVSFRHGVAGRVVKMRAGYLLDGAQPGQPVTGEAGQVSVTHGTQHTDMSYSYIQRGGAETFHPFDYLAFRYFQIDDPSEALTASDVVALTRHTVVPDEHGATFSSSDPTLDAVFELGRHSALFTAQEQFVDTPTREKGPWLWDGFNESQTAMAAFGEQNLTRQSLLDFAQSQSRYWPQGQVNKIYPTGLGAVDIGEFVEIYPEWVWQYWLRTGDRTLLRAVYPVLVNIAGFVWHNTDPSTGLVAYLPATSLYSTLAVTTRQNVLGVNVYRRAADVAAALGHSAAEVDSQRGRQATLTAAINQRLTRSDGTYSDGLKTDGTQSPLAGQDSNTVAVVFGVVPAARQPTVAAYSAGLGMVSVPATASELLAALRITGRYDDFVRLLTDAKADGWANILAQGGTFTWEVWRPQDSNGDSMSHGWGSDVLVEIQHALLGVTPTAPGFSSFDVTPPLSGLAKASGRVPTLRGTLVVDWSRPPQQGGAFALDVTVPPNADATIRLPASGPGAITESGQPLSNATGVRFVAMDGAYAVLHVGAGSYAFHSSPVPGGVATGSSPTG